MSAQNGTDMLVQVNLSDSAGDDWTTVAGQRGVTFSESTNLIDISSKDSGRHGDFLAGRITETVSLEALIDLDDLGYQHLRDASRNGTAVKLQKYVTGTGEVENVQAIVTTRDEDWPDQEAAVMSLEFQTKGAWAAA